MAKFITLREAADVLSISIDTARKHCLAGRLPCVRLGKLIRLPADFLDRLETPAKLS